MQVLQDSAAVYLAKTKSSVTQLRDQVLVQDAKHGMRNIKFHAADQLSDWMLYNPKGLSYWYDLTSCDLH